MGLLTDTQAASMTLSSWLEVSELEMWGGSRGISWVGLRYHELDRCRDVSHLSPVTSAEACWEGGRRSCI